jgi:predicted 2-oxoglutarate/Fe(II)-dependent dioxygenase YbiX
MEKRATVQIQTTRITSESQRYAHLERSAWLDGRTVSGHVPAHAQKTRKNAPKNADKAKRQ